jgi:heat shock protein HslJ
MLKYAQNLRRVVAVFALVVALTGCAPLSPNPTGSPLGGTWHVSELNGVPVDHADAAVIQFTVGGDIQGSSGCHDFRGPARVGDGTLEVGTLTLGPPVACAKSTREAEAAFLAVLRQVTSFRAGRPGAELVLEGAAGTIVLASGM